MKVVSKVLVNKENNQFIKRWPACPKIAVYGPPNIFMEEISTRMAVDLGVPILKP